MNRLSILMRVLCVALVASCTPAHPALAQNGISANNPARPTPFDATANQNITGTWTFTTQSAGDNSTKAATTAYVDAAIAALAITSDGVGDTNYTIPFVDQLVTINAAFTAARTFTLPAAGLYRAGAPLEVEDAVGAITSSNTLILARAGSDTIILASGSVTSVTVKTPYARLVLISDGSSKWTLGVQAPIVGGTGTSAPPSSGQLLVGTAGGVYAPQTVSGACTLSSAGAITCTQVTGVTDGSSAAAGLVDEPQTATVASGSAVSLTTATTANGITLPLTAGRWIVYGTACFTGSATSVTYLAGGLSTNSTPTLPSAQYTFALPRSGALAADACFTSPPLFLTSNASLNVYMATRDTFSGGTLGIYGAVYGIRE